MAGLFIMFVMALALSGLVNDYFHSVSDSDDSEPTPLIVFTQDDDNNDWQKDEPIKKSVFLYSHFRLVPMMVLSCFAVIYEVFR
jgi:hypothetical protein